MTFYRSSIQAGIPPLLLTLLACGRVRSGGSQDASSDVPPYQDARPCPRCPDADASGPEASTPFQDGGPIFDGSPDTPWSLNLYTDAASDGFVALAPDAGGAFGSLVVLDERHVYRTGGPAPDGIGLSGVSSVSKAGGPVTQWWGVRVGLWPRLRRS